MKHPKDTDLDFLHQCTACELRFLVQLIIDIGGAQNRLDSSSAFKMNSSDPTKYVDEIIEEIQCFAGDTTANAVRGYGVPYREALVDTLTELHVGFDQRMDLAELERLLIEFGLPCYLQLMKDPGAKARFCAILEDFRVTGEGVVGIDCLNAKGVWNKVKDFVVDYPVKVLKPITGAATRVVTPAVIYIAKLRRHMEERGA